jgi:class 3 adenylate cyclase
MPKQFRSIHFLQSLGVLSGPRQRLLEFSSVLDAVRCASDLQRGMGQRNCGVSDEKQIIFRIGVNVGDIIIDQDDIFGEGVNVAARLEAIAEPGGICISRQVFEQVDGKLALSFRKLGLLSLKNITKPVEVFAKHLHEAHDACS